MIECDKKIIRVNVVILKYVIEYFIFLSYKVINIFFLIDRYNDNSNFIKYVF